jgi:lysyl endopeptidase
MITRYSLKYLLVLPFFFLFNNSKSQITSPGIPLFKPLIDTFFVPVTELLLEESLPQTIKDKSDINFKVDNFAVPVDVSINTIDYGVWIDYPEQNKRVWLIRIKSANALSLNILFDSYRLVEGVKVFIYNKNQSEILGALTSRNNKTWNSLSTSPIRGNEVYVELQVPTEVEYFGDFNIGQIGIEKASGIQLKSIQDEYFNQSADCHVNVNCFSDEYLKTHQRSTCRIVYLGSRRCTGTLLNNLNNNKTPYIITAAHCINTEYVAQTAIFDFNYESPDCESVDVPIQSISGASLVATSENLDFVLLRLSDDIPEDYNVYYSGWDARGIAPQSSYVLHHPEGDIKKISIDEDAATVSTYTDPNMDKNTHWLILDYETGSTENGSSGSGLISNENYLVGTLTGGGATCSDQIYDYYQMFSHDYNDYPDSVNQLQYWLDPNNTNKLTCKGINAKDEFRNSAQILTNISASDILESKAQTQGWGYVTGHNYQQNIYFAEHYTLNGSKYLIGANILTDKIDTSNIENVDFIVWQGGATPGKIIYETNFSSGTIDNNEFANKILIDFDSTLLVHDDFYFGYKISYLSDTFMVKSAATSLEENSAYTVLNNNWQALQFNGSSYSSKLAIELLAFDYLPDIDNIPDTAILNDIHIYPNPSINDFQVYLKNGISGQVLMRISDLTGRPVYSQTFVNPDSNIQLVHNLPAGVYVLSIFVNNKRYTSKKIMVLR